MAQGRDALLREAGLVRRALHRPQAAGAGGRWRCSPRWPRPYRVGASATVQGVVQRVVAAPFEGYIAEATRRAGDEVRQGDVLAVLDTRETELELLRAATWRCSTAARARRPWRAATAPPPPSPRRRRARPWPRSSSPAADPAFQPARAFDGVLVSGDLSQQLGEAVKRGQELFKLSPLDGYRLWLDVEDRQIDDVAVGQTGRVALAAMPDRQIPFTVTRIVPLAQVQEGKTVFRLEASLTPGESATLRPGMEGVGRIDIGERRYAWIWTHGFMDWLRLKWWAWFG